MSLRKSPERTPALLAANRANGRKSTGSQSILRSRHRELQNALRDGGRLARSLEMLARAPLRLQLDFARVYASLHKAVAPEPSEVDLALATAAFVWRAKRRIENRVRSPRFRAQMAAQNGQLPPPWRMLLDRPQGQVTVTIWVRPGRPRQTSAAGASGIDQPAPFYVGLVIRRKGRRPWQPSDGPLNSAAPGSSRDPFLPSEDCNRNSSDKVTVPFVKRNKIRLQAGMSKFMNNVRSYVRRLSGKL
jgi:hypothetical protein